MGVLEDWYSGLINPTENFGYPTYSEYLKLKDSVELDEQKILSCLEEKEQKVFENMNTHRNQMQSMELKRMFICAFKLGVQFGKEIFQE